MRCSRWVPAAVVVVVVVLALVLTGGLPGQGEEPEQTGLAVLTAEPWLGGQPPAAWVPVELPLRVLHLAVPPERVAAGGVVAARDVPSGVLLRASDLADEPPEGTGSVLSKVLLDVSGWPGAGPQVGGEAMFLDRTRGCAAHVVTLLDVEGSAASVAADPTFAEVLALGQPWRALPAPADPADLEVWVCDEPPRGRLVVPVAVSDGLLTGGPLRAGETVLLVPAAGRGQSVCAAAVVDVWGVPDGTAIEVAVTRSEAAELVREGIEGQWRVTRLPAGQTDAGVWRC